MVIELNENNFEEEVKNSKVPVIIDFFAEWCGPCQMMKPVFEKTSESFHGRLKFAKLNTEENEELTMKYNVQGIPCLILTKNGKEIERIVGYMPEAVLKKEIENILRRI